MNFNYQELIKQAEASGASSTYEPLPVGDYNVVVDKAESTNSKKGDPQLVITFKVVDGPFQNRKLWHRLTFIPTNGIALAINFRQLDALGATPILEQGGSLAQVAGFLLGKTASVKVAQREWNDKIQNDIADVSKSTTAAVGGFNPSGFTGTVPAQGGFNPTPVGAPVTSF